MPKPYLTALALCVFCASATASLRQYQATMASSNWTVTEQTPLSCKMEHAIPRFGKAKFQGKAGKDMALEMTLAMLRQPRLGGYARLVAVPPAYKPGATPIHLANVRVVEGFDTSLSQNQSWSVLTELEQGNNPTLFYQDGYRAGGDVEVMLNSANFQQGYKTFLDCVGQLLPYGFDDVQQTVLNYQSNSDELDLESLRRLHQLVDYLSYDPAITRVEIDAYTDSYGGRWLNSELSKKRADSLKRFLVEAGIQENLLQTTGYGEGRHIASNETELGRQQNRRVVMRLTRDPSYDEKMKLPSSQAKLTQSQPAPINAAIATADTVATNP